MNQTTIKMPAAMLAAWLAALRSGKYPQGKGRLKTEGGSYCCLGVLQMAVDGQCEKYPDESNSYRALPSEEWLESKGIQFSGCTCPQIPRLPSLGVAATDANDVKEKSFAEIADAIEACAVGV